MKAPNNPNMKRREKMKCEKAEELLSPYIEDELSIEEKKAVESHLETCKKCSFLFSSIEEGSTTFKGESSRIRPSQKHAEHYAERFESFLQFLDRV